MGLATLGVLDMGGLILGGKATVGCGLEKLTGCRLMYSLSDSQSYEDGDWGEGSFWEVRLLVSSVDLSGVEERAIPMPISMNVSGAFVLEVVLVVVEFL